MKIIINTNTPNQPDLSDLRDQAADVEDWRTVDEIDAIITTRTVM